MSLPIKSLKLAASLLYAFVACFARADESSKPSAPQAEQLPLAGFSAIGASFAKGNHLTELGWNEAQVAAFIEGIRGAFNGKEYPFDEAAKQVSAEMGRRVHEIESNDQRQAFNDPAQLKAYLAAACKRYNLEQTDSGLCYTLQTAGKGNRPGIEDTVLMSCVAVASDGTTKLPQLSGDHFKVRVAELLPGIREGIQMMANTSRALFLLPPALSFGNATWPDGVDAGTPLLFQVTLHEVLARDAKAR